MKVWVWECFLTLASLATSVYTGACYEHIVNYSKTAFAANPLAIRGYDTCIVQSSSLVQANTSFVNITGNWNFVWVEVIERRTS